MSIDNMNTICIRRAVRPAISLDDAKRSILGITPEIVAAPDGYVTAVVNRFILSNGGISQSMAAIVRLHALCMVGNFVALNNFIQNFSQTNGIIATELLLNSRIHVGSGVPNCSSFYMTPIQTVLFWNKNKELIKLMLTYGASHCVDLDNIFPEEKLILIPYFDHLSGGNWGPYPKPMWRMSQDFHEIVQELRSNAGEIVF